MLIVESQPHAPVIMTPSTKNGKKAGNLVNGKAHDDQHNYSNRRNKASSSNQPQEYELQKLKELRIQADEKIDALR